MKRLNLIPSKIKRELKQKQPDMKHLPLSEQQTAAPGICGDQSGTKMSQDLEPLSFVSAIKNLPLTVFIACVVDSDLSGIVKTGNPTDVQLYSAWLTLLSQYYEARQDKAADGQRKSIMEMESLQLRQVIIAEIQAAGKIAYRDSLFDALKVYGHSQFAYTKESYLNDLKVIFALEKMNEMRFNTLKSSFDKQQKNGAAKQTEQTFYEYVMTYNEAFKTSYTVDRLNAYEYALLCKRLDKHIEHLNAQNKK